MECCLFLRGDLFIAESPLECSKGVDDSFGCTEKTLTYRKLGNSSTCEVMINSEIYGKENPFNKVNPKARMNIMGMNLNITMDCVTKENLALAFMATEKKKTSDEVKDLVCFCRCIEKGDTIILSETPVVDDMEVSIKDAFGNILQYLVNGIDYRIEDKKLIIIDAESFNENAITIQVVYRYELETTYELDSLMMNPSYKDVMFVGENVADGEKVSVRFFRVLFQPISQFDLISKGSFLNLPLNGVVEESKYGWFKFEKDGLDGISTGTIY